jgi:putative ABC transport system permease protein
LRKDRGVTAIAIAILSIGIGSSTAIFTLMNTVLFRTLPVSEPHRLVQVNRTGPGGAGPWVSFPTYQQLRESPGFDGMLTTNGASLWRVAIGW